MVQMTKEILDIVNAVLTFKKFVFAHNQVMQNNNFDCYGATEAYFKSLPLPEGMKHSKKDFEQILQWGEEKNLLERLNNTNYSDLHYTYWRA